MLVLLLRLVASSRALRFVTNVRSPEAGQVGCPYAQRVEFALNLASLEYERVEVDLRDKPDWLLAANPLGRVPCLIDGDGEAIAESMALCEYVDEVRSEGAGLLPAAAAARAAARALAWRCDTRFIPAGFRYLCYGRGRGRLDAFLSELGFLDDGLRRSGGPFLGGADSPSLADVAYAPFFERLDAALAAHRGGSVREICDARGLDALRAWLDALDARPEYRATKCASPAAIAAVYRPRATRRMSYLRQ